MDKKKSWWLTPMVPSLAKAQGEMEATKDDLIPCKACGEEIHKTAECCPRCGKRLRMHSAVRFVIFALAGMILLPILFQACYTLVDLL